MRTLGRRQPIPGRDGTCVRTSPCSSSTVSLASIREVDALDDKAEKLRVSRTLEMLSKPDTLSLVIMQGFSVWGVLR